MLGGGGGVAGGSVDDDDALFGGGIDGDVVDADAGAADDLAPPVLGDDVGLDLGLAAHEERVVVADDGLEVGGREA